MKAFENPFVEVKKFDVDDVLTTSSVTESTEEEIVIICEGFEID